MKLQCKKCDKIYNTFTTQYCMKIKNSVAKGNPYISYWKLSNSMLNFIYAY